MNILPITSPLVPGSRARMFGLTAWGQLCPTYGVCGWHFSWRARSVERLAGARGDGAGRLGGLIVRCVPWNRIRPRASAHCLALRVAPAYQPFYGHLRSRQNAEDQAKE